LLDGLGDWLDDWPDDWLGDWLDEWLGDALGRGVPLGVELGVGSPDGVPLWSSMMIVWRGVGSSAAFATRVPVTNAPSGSIRARAAKTFQKLRMTPRSSLKVGCR